MGNHHPSKRAPRPLGRGARIVARRRSPFPISMDNTPHRPRLPTMRLQFTLRGHQGEIGSIAWSPNGRLIASAGERGAVVWDAVSHTTTSFLPAPGGESQVMIAVQPPGCNRQLLARRDYRLAYPAPLTNPTILHYGHTISQRTCQLRCTFRRGIMRYTTFGRRTGLRVSEYGLGTGNFGTQWGMGAERAR